MFCGKRIPCPASFPTRLPCRPDLVAPRQSLRGCPSPGAPAPVTANIQTVSFCSKSEQPKRQRSTSPRQAGGSPRPLLHAKPDLLVKQGIWARDQNKVVPPPNMAPFLKAFPSPLSAPAPAPHWPGGSYSMPSSLLRLSALLSSPSRRLFPLLWKRGSSSPSPLSSG